MDHTATCKNIDTVATDEEISKRILLSARLLQMPTEQDSNLHFSGCGLTDPITHMYVAPCCCRDSCGSLYLCTLTFASFIAICSALVNIFGHPGARVLKVVSDVPSIGLELANALEQAVKTNGR